MIEKTALLKVIAARLKEARGALAQEKFVARVNRALGLSDEEGWSSRTVGNYEKGEDRTVDLRYLADVSAATGVPLAHLLGLEARGKTAVLDPLLDRFKKVRERCGDDDIRAWLDLLEKRVERPDQNEKHPPPSKQKRLA